MSANRGAKITLYWLERSRAQRIMWLLEELKLICDIKTFKRNANGTAPKELRSIHPLGKSPLLKIEAPEIKPKVLAESAVIMEYLLDHFDGVKYGLVPQRYPGDGADKEQIAGETEAWMRYRYFMHYAEGSLMSPIQVAIIMNTLKKAPLPFFIKPVVNLITSKIGAEFLDAELRTHFRFLEEQLRSAPSGGPFLCGPRMTAADIQMSIPVQAGRAFHLMTSGDFPKLKEYLQRIESSEGYQNTVKKIEEIEGEPFVPI